MSCVLQKIKEKQVNFVQGNKLYLLLEYYKKNTYILSTKCEDFVRQEDTVCSYY